jgi:hypothetical protein
MAKLYDEDGNEVEAFTQAEVDAQLEEVKTSAKTEVEKAFEKERAEHAAELAKKDKVIEDKKTSYEELKKKYGSDITKVEEVNQKLKDTHTKMRDKYLDKLAGDDADYKKALQEEFEKRGVDSVDPDEIQKELKIVHAIVNVDKDDVRPFTFDGNTGNPPVNAGGDGNVDAQLKSAASFVGEAMGYNKVN